LADLFTELDAQVRRVDEDRWLASRFAPLEVRKRLVALYALDDEIARTSQVVSEPAIGAIRLAWWRDALTRASAGKQKPGHPTLEAFADTGLATPKVIALLSAGIEARAAEFDGSHLNALHAHIDATTGGSMRAAALVCASEIDEALISIAARAWGLCDLMRRDDACAHQDLAAAAQAAFDQLKGREIPLTLFPAIGYVSLTPIYVRAWRNGRATPSLLNKQIALVIASARGRL
jgi:15-cis-phytoene synthase